MMSKIIAGRDGGTSEGPLDIRQDHAWVRLAAPVATVAGVPLVVPWNEVVEQDGGIFALAAPTDFVIRRNGLYVISTSLEWDIPGVNGTIRAALLRRVRSGVVRDIAGTGVAPVSNVSALTTIVGTTACLPCRAGDIFRVTGLQDSGGGLNILGSAGEFGYSMFQALKVA